LSVELNSSYSIDEVVRFKTQDVLDKDLMVISLETPVHPLEIISSRSGAADIVNTAGSYFVSDRGNTYYGITKKNSTDNFSTSNYDGIIGSGYTSNQNLSLSGGENGSFYLGLGNVKQEGVVETVLTKEPILISIRLTNWERNYF
jgi:hypothetical protein